MEHSTDDGIATRRTATRWIDANKEMILCEFLVVVPTETVFNPFERGMGEGGLKKIFYVLVERFARHCCLIALHENPCLPHLLSHRLPRRSRGMHTTPQDTCSSAVGTNGNNVMDTELARCTDRVHETGVLRRVVICLGTDEEEHCVAHLDERDDGNLHHLGVDEITLLGDDDLLAPFSSLSSESLEARVSV